MRLESATERGAFGSRQPEGTARTRSKRDRHRERNARRSDRCLRARALSPLFSPRPPGRIPTIRPVSSNALLSPTHRLPRLPTGVLPLGKRKTRPETAPAWGVTIIASGAIRTRNPAEATLQERRQGGGSLVRAPRSANAMSCRKSETRLSLSHDQSCASDGLDRTLPSRRHLAPGKASRKILLAKNPRNPLKSLVSGERIQGNPRKSNPQERGLQRETPRRQENPNAA
jgi:hypothetical protein